MGLTPYYDHAGITIYHGDCLEILPTLEPVDCVVTDPPYGYSHCSNWDGPYKKSTIANDENTSARDSALVMVDQVPAAVFGA